MIKCIASDMDGTLLTATQTITDENIAAIKKAQEKGIEVVVATGRSYQEAIFVLEEAGLECPIICANGAEVRSAQGEIVSNSPLDKELATRTAKALTELEVYYEVYTNQGTYTVDEKRGITIMADIFLSGNEEADVKKVLKAAEERFEKGLVHKVDSYDVLFESEDHQIYKLLAFTFDPERMEEAKEALQDFEGLIISSSGHGNLELTSKSAQKGVALEAFVREKGISLEETMALGDNYNDLSMFNVVGRAVAMGNADDYIKSQCHMVTLTNEESGVGKAILEVL
ncbi:Cof-type HAD-IIB family hydrolase [Cytobacillus gottheilii]|uniref:Cof-type HAD-IIB family hydrolase n=1 Tax=Cytobacillus gottheilii TaxID=859144 RepID=A0ABX8FBN5_9BACI|nr:Cof-type HAD-IIB family hydrolase [Cytobacillus gottheilii]QVY61449.1 Cof-type HAD-IIB family hydrolase [Cytobacillus gottheilii]